MQQPAALHKRTHDTTESAQLGVIRDAKDTVPVHPHSLRWPSRSRCRVSCCNTPGATYLIHQKRKESGNEPVSPGASATAPREAGKNKHRCRRGPSPGRSQGKPHSSTPRSSGLRVPGSGSGLRAPGSGRAVQPAAAAVARMAAAWQWAAVEERPLLRHRRSRTARRAS